MKHIVLNINADGKYPHLSEVLPLIPTNTVINKTLTGIGATYCELKAPRHSVIIEPNKPVIAGKAADPKHAEDNILGVFEGVYEEDVEDYIKETLEKGLFIKIMTTPESFNKVKRAFELTGMDIRFDCFLLYDECHKLPKDIDYRKTIDLPMELFFQCEQKALVSATPIQFSDPRLGQFEWLRIELEHPVKQHLNLLVTNNTLQRLAKLIKEQTEDLPFFIFCNSTDCIYALMKQIGLLEDSAVFCSQKSVDKLKELKFKQAHDTWDVRHMKRYNFLTSRFYNAVDIELDVQPVVVLFTDCYFAEHTCFDPYADARQCIGRLRNGVAAVYHISNFNSNFQVRSKQGLEEYVRASGKVYSLMQTLYRNTTSQPAKEAFRTAMDCLPYTQWLNPDGSLNFFAVDNYIDKEWVKGDYAKSDYLYDEYKKDFEVRISYVYFPLGDYERLRRQNNSISLREKREIMLEQLETLGKCETELEFLFLDDLRKADPLMVEAYEKLGTEKIKELRFRTAPMRQAIILYDYQHHPNGLEVFRMMNESFVVGLWYDLPYIKEEIKRIHSLLGVKRPRGVTAQTIHEYFTVKKKWRKKKEGYVILEPKLL